MASNSKQQSTFKEYYSYVVNLGLKWPSQNSENNDCNWRHRSNKEDIRTDSNCQNYKKIVDNGGCQHNNKHDRLFIIFFASKQILFVRLHTAQQNHSNNSDDYQGQTDSHNGYTGCICKCVNLTKRRYKDLLHHYQNPEN